MARKKHRMQMSNDYCVDGNVVTIYNRRDGRAMTFDAADLEMLSVATWYISNGYVAAMVNQKMIKAHRLLLGLPDTAQFDVDHVDGNPLNNRRNNIRLVTRSQNNHNRRNAKGYHFDKRTGKWRAQIVVDGRTRHVGSYQTQEEARSAYLAAKKVLHPSTPADYFEVCAGGDC